MDKKKKLFLSDDPINEEKQDAFGHKTLVETLYKCVKECQCKINIGFFGKWGVGKTSIVELLTNKFEKEDQDVKFFVFDSWKYSHSSLPHQLVLMLNRKFKILKQKDLESEIYEIREEPAIPREKGVSATLKSIWYEFSIAIVLTILLYVLLIGLHFGGVVSESLFTTLIFIVFIPIAYKLLSEIVTSKRTTGKVIALPAKFNPEQLADKFDKIVKGIVGNKDQNRLVIIIDNLDRCAGETAIEMLAAIKNIMEHDRCVYVFPCDHSALIEHLKSVRKYKEGDATEFLRKFFQASFTIPPFLSQDLEQFTSDLLSELEIPYGPAVLQVIVNAFTENPRSIKQFLNNLTTQHLMAEHREAANIVAEGELTSNDDFLAKLLVMRQEYPNFYSELEKREDLLELAETYFRGGADPSTDEYFHKLFNDYPRLEQFLLGTRPVAAKDISPFLKLNRETYPGTIPDATEFKLRVNNGDVNYISNNLDGLEQEDEKKEYIYRILGVIKNEHRARHFVWVFNGINILTKIYEKIPVSIKASIADEIGILVTLRELRADLNRFEYGAMFSLIKDIQETYRNHILDAYTDMVFVSGIDMPLVDQIISVHELMPGTAIDKLNNQLAQIYKQERERAEIVINKITEKPEARDKLISENLISEIEGSVDTSLSNENRKTIGIYLILRSRALAQTRLSFLQKILTIISTNEDGAFDDSKQFGLQNLLALEKADVPVEGIEGLYNTLNKFTGLMGAPNEKLEFIKVFFKFFDVFQQTQQEEFLQSHLLPLVDSADADILSNVLETAVEFNAKVLSYEFLLDRFINRVQTSLPDSGLLSHIIRNTPAQYREKLKDMLIQLINHPNSQYHNLGLDNFSEFYSEFNSSQIGEICDACLQRASNADKTEKQKFINPILVTFKKCPAQFKRNFANFTLACLRNEDTDIRDIGIDCFRKTERLIEDVKKKEILTQLIHMVAQRASQNIIDQNSKPILDLISDYQDSLEKDDVISYIDSLNSLRRTDSPKEVQLIRLEYLGKIKELYHRKRLIRDLVREDLESADPDISEQAKRTLDMIESPNKKSRDESSNSLSF